MSEYSVNSQLSPGVSLPASPERDKLDQIETEAYEQWYSSRWNPVYIAAANAIANSVADIPGIELITGAGYGTDSRNRCAHYAFGKHLGEDWAEVDSELPSELWNEPVKFLVAKGFAQITTPTVNDIIAYTNLRDTAEPNLHVEFSHFAVALGDSGQAISKLGRGAIIKHPMELVPTSYGDTAFFFRK